MKFLADLESRRACTGIDTSEAVSITIAVRGCIFTIAGLITLTTGRGGWISPQYRHKPWVSRFCRSADASQIVSTCIGSWPGSGVLVTQADGGMECLKMGFALQSKTAYD